VGSRRALGRNRSGNAGAACRVCLARHVGVLAPFHERPQSVGVTRERNAVQVLSAVLCEPKSVTPRERVQVLYVFRFAPLCERFELVPVGVDGGVG